MTISGHNYIGQCMSKHMFKHMYKHVLRHVSEHMSKHVSKCMCKHRYTATEPGEEAHLRPDCSMYGRTSKCIPEHICLAASEHMSNLRPNACSKHMFSDLPGGLDELVSYTLCGSVVYDSTRAPLFFLRPRRPALAGF